MSNKEIFFGFDIDETIIHSVEGLKSKYDVDPAADFYIKSDDTDLIEYEVYVRPNIDIVLNKVAKDYNLFFYTRAIKSYAEKILDVLGYQDYPLFTREDTVQEKDIGPYSDGRVYHVKNLNHIAKRLNTTVENIVFVDDVRNIQEIRPVEAVMRISEFNTHSVKDNEFTKLYKFLGEVKGTNQEVIQQLRSFHFPEFQDKKKNIIRRKM
jgi:TFIIF-interacting CTD phosphatase-like protein